MNQPFRIKNKTDFSEYEKKLKRAGKEIERLNRIIAD
jgi:predicted  nucleic acid-binding Zn-ribbon protein